MHAHPWEELETDLDPIVQMARKLDEAREILRQTQARVAELEEQAIIAQRADDLMLEAIGRNAERAERAEAWARRWKRAARVLRDGRA